MDKTREFFGCCCGVSLGTKVVAILGIFSNILLFLNGSVSKLNIQNQYISDDLTFNGSIGLACVHLLFNSLLFYGAVNKKHGFILPWIILNITILVLFAFITIVLFIFLTTIYQAAALAFLIIAIIIFAIYTHIVVCVNHYYSELKNTHKNVHQPLYAMSS